MGTNRNAYIHQIGTHVINRIGCSHEIMKGVYDDDEHFHHQYDHNSPEFPQVFWSEYGSKVIAVVSKMGSSARGRILACGVAQSGNGMVAYHEVSGGHCDTKVSGEELLSLLASCVVAAAIVDIFRQRVRESEMYDIEDARQRHLEQGVPSENMEWFLRNPLPGD